MNYQDLERSSILCAARELIEHAGWQELELEILLQRAGVCDQSFHRHFSCVDGLLAALLDDELRNASTRLRDAATPKRSPAERIHSYIATMIDCVYPMERYGRASAFASIWLKCPRQHLDQIDPLVDDLVQPLREAIREGCEAGAMSSHCPDDDAQAIFHLVIGMIVTQAALGRQGSPAHIKGTLTGTVTRALGFTEH